MADVDLGNLAVYLRARIDKLEADLRAGRQATENARRSMQTNMDHISASTQRMSGHMSGAASQARLLGTVISSYLSARMLGLAEEIGDTAAQIGISAEKLQSYRVAADLAGASSAGVTRSLQYFSRQLGDSSEEANGFRNALGQLGIDWRELKKLSFDEALETVSTALNGVSDSSRRAAVGQELFSRGALRTMNFLRLGADELRNIQKEANKLGLIISNDVIETAGKAKDQFDLFTTGLRAAGIQIAAGLLPVLKELVMTVGSPEFQSGVKSAAENFVKFIKVMVDNKEAIVAVVGALAAMKALRMVGVAGPAAMIGGLAAGAGTAIRASRSDLQNLENDIERAKDTIEMYRKVASGETPTLLGDTSQSIALKRMEEWGRRLLGLQVRYEELKKVKEETAAVPEPGADGGGGPLKVTTGRITFPAVKDAIKELELQRGVLTNEFGEFTDGFAEKFGSLKLQGVPVLEELRKGLANIHPELRALNLEMAKNNGAKVWLETRTPLEKYNLEMEKLSALQKTVNMDQDTFNRKAQQLAFPQLTAAINDMNNWRGQLDQLTVGSVNKTADALADIVDGTKDAKTAFRDLAKSVVRDLTVMIIKAQLFRIVSGLIPSFGGINLSQGSPGMGGAPFAVGHSGGVVGNLTQSRYVHPAYFDNAPRMHSGGRIGSNERAVIAEVGEIMLPKGSKIGGGNNVSIKVFPAAAGETFTQRTGSDGSIELIGMMIDKKLGDFSDRALPSRVAQINADRRAR